MAKQDKSKGASASQARAQAAASATTPAADVISALQNASCNYTRALQNAWQRASLDASQAANDLSDSQQRLLFEAGNRRSAAYQQWCEAVRDGGNKADDNANRAYRDAVTAASQDAQGNWQKTHQTHQEAVTAVNQGYANAAQEALQAYLAELKGIWSGANLEVLDAQTLSRLAEATHYAAYAARSVQRS